MQTIGRYQIQDELGRGGMATVYKAYDPHFERNVAIKVLPPAFLHDPQFRARFQREARTIAALEHPAIVPVYDYGEENNQLFLVMRLMTGGSLIERIARGPLSLEETADIINRLAPGLDAAHQRGIIHRDLKPANILFDEWNQPYLSDFGIVKLVEDSETALTATGGMVGTPAYMSPEQVQAVEELDARSDIYALGVIAYEMLSGEPPYKANTPMGLALKHVTDPVPTILDKKAGLPTQVQWVIQRAMAKERNNRYPSTAELAQDLQSTTNSGAGDVRQQAYSKPAVTLQSNRAVPDAATLHEPFQSAQAGVSPAAVQPLPFYRRLPTGLAFLSGMFVFVLCSGIVLYSVFSQGGLGGAASEAPPIAQLTEPASEAVAAVPSPTTEPAQTAQMADAGAEEGTQIVEEVAAPVEEIAVTSQLGQDILDRGFINIGWRGDDLWPFALEDEKGDPTGFEIMLVEEIVGRLFGRDFPIEWQSVTVANRFVLLGNGQIDTLVRNLTHTTSRDEFGDWSSNYFLDGQRFMVRPNSSYQDTSDLDGHTICVQAETTTRENLAAYFSENGWQYDAVDSYLTTADLWDAFVSGQCGALSTDWSLMLSLSGEGSPYRIIGPIISSEPFAIGIPPGNQDFRDEVDSVLIEIVEDGTWEQIYDQWFPDPPPWTLEEMLSEPPPDR